MNPKWFIKMGAADNDGAASGGAIDGQSSGKGAGGNEQGAGGASSDNTGDEGSAGESGKGYWPDDWRQNIAGEDAKLLKRFERYQSPADVAKALIAAQNKISSGELRPTLGADASPEQLADYRKALGIPETPDKYDTNLGDGTVFGEEDKPIIDEFLKVAHASNQTPDQVKSTLKAYTAIQDMLSEQRAEQDNTARISAEDTLRSEWGTEFKRNINIINGLFDTIGGEELRDNIFNGRLADGTPIGSSPEALRAFASLALQLNPSATVVPPGVNQAKNIDDEIAAIESKMGTKEYTRDEKMQSRYRELINAREQMKQRKAG